MNSAAALLPDGAQRTAYKDEIAEQAKKHDLEYLRAEVPKAFTRTFDGVDRVTNIVKAMKEFAHPDANEQSPVDLPHALETTLLVASNEYKYVAKVRTEFGEMPQVVCNVGELNQGCRERRNRHSHLQGGRSGRYLRERQWLRSSKGKPFQAL
jgi:hypothetical protein